MVAPPNSWLSSLSSLNGHPSQFQLVAFFPERPVRRCHFKSRPKPRHSFPGLTCWDTCHFVAVIFPKRCFKGLQNSFCATNILICCCVPHYCIKCCTRTWCKTLSIIHALTWLSSFLSDILQLLTFQFIFSQENNWLTFNTDTDPGKILLDRRILK